MRLALNGERVVLDGTTVEVRPRSLHLSGATPAVAKAVRSALRSAGVELRGFAAGQSARRLVI